ERPRGHRARRPGVGFGSGGRFLPLHLGACDDRRPARVSRVELPEGKDLPRRRRRLSARVLAGGALRAPGGAASGGVAVVPDAAARLSDLRDSLFDVSKESHARAIARTAGPDAPAPGDLHAADAGPHGRLRPCSLTRFNSRVAPFGWLMTLCCAVPALLFWRETQWLVAASFLFC